MTKHDNLYFLYFHQITIHYHLHLYELVVKITAIFHYVYEFLVLLMYNDLIKAYVQIILHVWPNYFHKAVYKLDYLFFL